MSTEIRTNEENKCLQCVHFFSRNLLLLAIRFYFISQMTGAPLIEQWQWHLYVSSRTLSALMIGTPIATIVIIYI